MGSKDTDTYLRGLQVPLVTELPRGLLPRSYQTGFRKGGYLLPTGPLVPVEPSGSLSGAWCRPVLLASLRLRPFACPI